MLGSAQINAGQKEQAVTTYSKLVSLQPNSATALHGLQWRRPQAAIRSQQPVP